MRRIGICILAVLIATSVSSCIGCTPEDVDNCVEGFKEGYFGKDYDKESNRK